MTTLAITPSWKNKGAKFRGTVAAGEHVSVTIQNDDGEGGEFIEDVSTLRLRVVDPCNGRTLAIFPEPVPEGETPETWGADLSPLRCTLNLNTVQMLKAVPPAANVPLLWVLDDYYNKTLYFKEQFPVEHWPRLRGEEEPTDLDNYKDIIAEFDTRLTAAEETIANSAQAASAAATAATVARDAASSAATAATDAQTGAIASKNAAQTAANNAANSAQVASDAEDNANQAASDAQTAQSAAEAAAEAAEAALPLDTTLSLVGKAAEAKAVGDLVSAENRRAVGAEEALSGRIAAEVTARETLAGAVQVDRQNLANEISRAQAAEQGLRADVTSAQTAIADRYTKTEVDAKIAGVQTFQKYLVQTLPDADEADMKGLYLVPTGETSEEGDLCEEWTVVEDSGEKRWEKIGGTTVDLSNYYTKGEADALLAGKMPSTATGSDIPTAATPSSPTVANSIATLTNTTQTLGDSISTLSDTKASKADATLTERGFSEWTVVPGELETERTIAEWTADGWIVKGEDSGSAFTLVPKGDADSTSLSWTSPDEALANITATRTALPGYTLGSQADKPLASEAEAETLRTEVSGKANRAPNPTAGNLAALDANGNPTDSGVKPSDFATAAQGAKADAALSRTEAEAGFTEWVFQPATFEDEVCSVIYEEGEWYLYLGGSFTGQTDSSPEDATSLSFMDGSITATRTRLPTMADANAKLDSTSAAPEFSASATYAVGARCTYNGKLYVCVVAKSTASATTPDNDIYNESTAPANHWAVDTMTDPDAVLDITSQNQLRVVAKDGTLLWAQGYDLASTSSATLACDAANNFTFADGATTQAFTLPTAPTGKVGDFGLDIDNSANTGAATMTLTGLDTAFSVVVPKGESLTDMLSIAAGELAQFYVTLTTFRVNNLPTWHIVKQVVENGGAQS